MMRVRAGQEKVDLPGPALNIINQPSEGAVGAATSRNAPGRRCDSLRSLTKAADSGPRRQDASGAASA